MEQYGKQKQRGRQGFGFFDGENLVRSPKENKIKRKLMQNDSSSILFHHRFPTSTANVWNACHPFSTKDYFETEYVLIHNGWIVNDYELAEAHNKQGINYFSDQKTGEFNDSEALLWDVALYLEGKQDKLEAYGAIAFICLAIPKDRRKTKKLYFGRNNNPLNMVYNEGGIFLSSEGAGQPIDPHTLYNYNYRTKRLSTTELTMDASRTTHVTNTEKDWWHNDDLYEMDEDGKLNRGPLPAPRLGLLTFDSVNLHFSDLFNDDPGLHVYTSSDGLVVNLKDELSSRAKVYLEEGYGKYQAAYDLIQDDIKRLERDILVADLQDEEPDELELLEVDILKGLCDSMLFAETWVTSVSLDPWYIQTHPSKILRRA